MSRSIQTLSCLLHKHSVLYYNSTRPNSSTGITEKISIYEANLIHGYDLLSNLKYAVYNSTESYKNYQRHIRAKLLGDDTLNNATQCKLIIEENTLNAFQNFYDASLKLNIKNERIDEVNSQLIKMMQKVPLGIHKVFNLIQVIINKYSSSKYENRIYAYKKAGTILQEECNYFIGEQLGYAQIYDKIAKALNQLKSHELSSRKESTAAIKELLTAYNSLSTFIKDYQPAFDNSVEQLHKILE